MMPMPTVVLRHTQAGDTHYDWLLPDPADPQGRLWTARVACHPQHWPKLRHWKLTPIASHRRTYLTYQGPVSNQRGVVTRVDAGQAIVESWTTGRRVILLHTRWLNARVVLTSLSATLWQAAIT